MYLVLAFIVLGALTFANQEREKLSAQITFCNFVLSDSVKVGNESFNVIYSFNIGEEGRPTQISRILDDYVGEARVSDCLSNWRFEGIKKGSHMIASFRWQHGVGWSEVGTSGGGFSQKMKITGERCPYRPSQ